MVADHAYTIHIDPPEFQQKVTRHSTGGIEGNVDTDEISKSLIQIRKQRALSDIQILEERKKVNLYREENETLKKKVASIMEDRELLIKHHEKELDILRRALLDSVNKCRNLEKLNEEVYTLLMIQSAENHYDR